MKISKYVGETSIRFNWQDLFQLVEIINHPKMKI